MNCKGIHNQNFRPASSPEETEQQLVGYVCNTLLRDSVRILVVLPDHDCVSRIERQIRDYFGFSKMPTNISVRIDDDLSNTDPPPNVLVYLISYHDSLRLDDIDDRLTDGEYLKTIATFYN